MKIKILLLPFYFICNAFCLGGLSIFCFPMAFLITSMFLSILGSSIPFLEYLTLVFEKNPFLIIYDGNNDDSFLFKLGMWCAVGTGFYLLGEGIKFLLNFLLNENREQQCSGD